MSRLVAIATCIARLVLSRTPQRNTGPRPIARPRRSWTGVTVTAPWGSIQLSERAFGRLLLVVALTVVVGMTGAVLSAWLRGRAVEALAPYAVGGELRLSDERITRVELGRPLSEAGAR